MPYVTEELWHHLPGNEGSIMVAAFPRPDKTLVDRQGNEQVAVVMDVTTAIRNIRGEMNVAPAAQVEAMVFGPESLTTIITTHGHYIEDLARLSALELVREGERPRVAASAVVRELELFVPLEGVLDFKEENRRLQKEISKLEPELARTQKKLANDAFLSRAPADIVTKEKNKLERLGSKLDKLQAQLEKVKKISGGR
jgi:valyl-tRNA synthetase